MYSNENNKQHLRRGNHLLFHCNQIHHKFSRKSVHQAVENCQDTHSIAAQTSDDPEIQQTNHKRKNLNIMKMKNEMNQD